MSFINNLLTKIFGSKYEKDMKEIAPIVAKIKEIYPTINSLSNDELRLRTTALRQQIAEAICDLQKKSDELRNEAESNECPIDKKDSLYKEIDEIEKQVDSKVEEVLTQILPEAFAIIKDTARRFSENEEIIVTASERDREIASAKELL